MKDLLPFVPGMIFGLLWYFEMERRKKAEADLAVVIKRKVLDGIGTKITDNDQAYQESLANFTRHLVPDHILHDVTSVGHPIIGQGDQEFTEAMAPLREEEDISAYNPQLKAKFFYATASEDIREGQACYITVDSNKGRTTVAAAAPRGAKYFPGES